MPASYPTLKGQYRSVTELVYQRVLLEILEGRLRPGEWIRQDAVARDMQISKIPVREALRMLEADGYVVFEPNRGARVTDFTIEELQELYIVRAALEPFAARLAVPNLTETDMDALRESIRLQDEQNQGGQNPVLARTTREFHFIIYRRSNRPKLCSKIEALWDGCLRYQHSYLDLPGGTTWTIDDHRRMVRACERRSASEVEVLVWDHIRTIADRMEAILASRQESQADPTS